MVPRVSKNPVNIYNAQRNLLLLYTYSDVAKAQAYGERMMTDLDDYLPVQQKELNFMLANASFLSGNHSRAKTLYRHTLKQAPQPKLESQVLNNLAFCSWMHLLELPKLTEADSAQKEAILKDESYVMTYLKQSIEVNERATSPGTSLQKLEQLLALELDGEPLTEDQEQEYFELLQGHGSGKAITNLAEYLLMTQAMKGEVRVSNVANCCRLPLFGSAAA